MPNSSLPTSNAPAKSTVAIDRPVRSNVNIDQFRERTFDKNNEVKKEMKRRNNQAYIFVVRQIFAKSSDTSDAPADKPASTRDSSHQALTNTSITSSTVTNTATESPVPSSTGNAQSLYSQVNIDQFRERTFDKSNEVNRPPATISLFNVSLRLDNSQIRRRVSRETALSI